MKKFIKILKYTMNDDEKIRIYEVEEKDILKLGWDEDEEEWRTDADNLFASGFYCNEEDRYIVDEEVAVFEIVDYEEISKEYDFYENGKDKIIAKIDGELYNLSNSRCQGMYHYNIVEEEIW